MAITQPAAEDQKFNPGDLASLAYSTNIDRRKCQRVVPMRVLGLGLSRTGTASMRQALIDLGYKGCYHFAAAHQENPSDQRIWIEALEAKFEGRGKKFTRTEFDHVLGHCQATTDNPTIIFYKELLEAYPEAKVVVTIRDDAEQWQHSYNATIAPFYNDFVATPRNLLQRIYQCFMPIDPVAIRFSNLVVKHSPIFRTAQQDYLDGTTKSRGLYYEHLEELRRLVPSENLLIMNIKEGWEPLCKFLGEEIPLYPFPRKNDTVSFQRNNVALGKALYSTANEKLLKAAITGLAIIVTGGMLAHRWGLWK